MIITEISEKETNNMDHNLPLISHREPIVSTLLFPKRSTKIIDGRKHKTVNSLGACVLGYDLSFLHHVRNS